MMKWSRKKILTSGIIGFLFVGLVISYRYSSKRLQFYGHYDKVWAHRVNSIKKLKSAENKFEGIELDLQYNDIQQKLFVTHAAQNFNLEFSDYINQIDNPKLKLWLDMKSLTPKNDSLIYNTLEKILNHTNYKNHKNRIIVESVYPSSLNIFKNAGYRTSLYITPITNTLSIAKRDSVKNVISNALSKQPDLEISGNYKNYEFFSTNFPTTPKNLWTLMSSYDKRILTEYGQIRQMIKDSTVKTFLTPYVNFNQYL